MTGRNNKGVGNDTWSDHVIADCGPALSLDLKMQPVRAARLSVHVVLTSKGRMIDYAVSRIYVVRKMAGDYATKVVEIPQQGKALEDSTDKPLDGDRRLFHHPRNKRCRWRGISVQVDTEARNSKCKL